VRRRYREREREENGLGRKHTIDITNPSWCTFSRCILARPASVLGCVMESPLAFESDVGGGHSEIEICRILP